MHLLYLSKIYLVYIYEKGASLYMLAVCEQSESAMVRGLTDSSPLPNIIAVSTHSVFNEGIGSCKTDGYHSTNIKQGKMGPHDQ